MHGTPTSVIPDVLQRCDHCAVRHQAVCGAMDEVQVKKLAQIAHRKKVPAGQTIISDEEPVDFFAKAVARCCKACMRATACNKSSPLSPAIIRRETS